MIPSFGYPTTTQGSLTEWGDLPMSRTWQGGCESPSLIPTTPPKRAANYFLSLRSAQHATGKFLSQVISEPNRPKRLRTSPLVLELIDPQDRQDNPPGREELTPEASRKKSTAVPTTNVGCTQATPTGRATPTPPLRMMSEDEHIRPPGKSKSHKACIETIPMFAAVEDDVSPTYSLPSPASTGRAPNATMRTAIKNNMDLVITTSLVSYGP